MAPPVHSPSGPPAPGVTANTNPTNLPPSSDSSSPNSLQRQNTATTPSNNNSSRIHPPMHERSRNARAQARHRAKRKAYIEQLEETVARLQAALSPHPPFNSGSSTSFNGNSGENPNEQSHSSLSVPLSSSGSPASAQIGHSSSPVSGNTGQGQFGVDVSWLHTRLRAIESECGALRQYADTIRGLLAQHAPNVQIPPTPFPSSLPPSTLVTATAASAPHSNNNANPNAATPANGTLPPLTPSHLSFTSSMSSASVFGHAAYRMGSSERAAGVKRSRRDSQSHSISDGRSEAGDSQSAGMGEGEIAGYSTPNPTPPLNTKNSASTPIHPSFPSSGINNLVNSNAGNRTGVPSLTLPPVPQSQPSPVHPTSAHSHTHPTPSAYTASSTIASSQAQQQPLSPLHQQGPYQQHHMQPQPNAHAHTSTTHSQPQITPMPPPVPYSGVPSVPSHGSNSAHAHGLQLPPPIPRFTGAQMPNLTRSFVYPLSSSPASNSTVSRQDGTLDGTTATNTDRTSRIGSMGGNGIGIGSALGNPALKREDDSDPGLSVGGYGSTIPTGARAEQEAVFFASDERRMSLGAENVYSQSQTQRHVPGRHQQQQESIHSGSPTSATASSPAVGFSSGSQQQHHHQAQQQHTQTLSPHATQQNYQQQQTPTMQRPLPSLLSHEHQHLTQTQNHFHHAEGHHQSLQPPQQHQHQHQQSSAASLPSPHSPYSPVGPNVAGPYRPYPEGRYHHHHSHHHHHHHHQATVHQQGQDQQVPNAQDHSPNTTNSNYLWTSAAPTNSVYGGR